jgi:hypothetical protein
MINPWNAASFLFQVIVLVFTGLSLGIAAKQARAHLFWLIPLVIGQILALLGSVPSFFIMNYVVSHHDSPEQMSWLLVPQQTVYGLSTLAHVWFAVALFLTLKSQVFAPHPAGPPQAPGNWPPPPSV